MNNPLFLNTTLLGGSTPEEVTAAGVAGFDQIELWSQYAESIPEQPGAGRLRAHTPAQRRTKPVLKRRRLPLLPARHWPPSSVPLDGGAERNSEVAKLYHRKAEAPHLRGPSKLLRHALSCDVKGGALLVYSEIQRATSGAW